MLELREEYRPNSVKSKRGLRKKNAGRSEFSFNVVRFIRVNEDDSEFRNGRSIENFKKMTGYFNGDYRELKGLEAIKSSVSGKP